MQHYRKDTKKALASSKRSFFSRVWDVILVHEKRMSFATFLHQLRRSENSRIVKNTADNEQISNYIEISVRLKIKALTFCNCSHDG
jgi:hypothetical protein